MSGLSKMATATYSTKRAPAESGSKGGPPVTYLTNVSFVPIMPLVGAGVTGGNIPQAPIQALRNRVGEFLITMAESQSHTEDSATVNQVPDVMEGDILVIDSVDYPVTEVQNWLATTALLAGIYVTIEESR